MSHAFIIFVFIVIVLILLLDYVVGAKISFFYRGNFVLQQVEGVVQLILFVSVELFHFLLFPVQCLAKFLGRSEFLRPVLVSREERRRFLVGRVVRWVQGCRRKELFQSTIAVAIQPIFPKNVSRSRCQVLYRGTHST
jgi:hypothetical protein